MKSTTLLNERQSKNLNQTALTHHHDHYDTDVLENEPFGSPLIISHLETDPEFNFSYIKHILGHLLNVHSLNFVCPDLHHSEVKCFFNGFSSVHTNVVTSNDKTYAIVPYENLNSDSIYNAPEKYDISYSNGEHHFYNSYKKSDIWNFGCIVYHLLTKRSLFNDSFDDKSLKMDFLQKENIIRTQIYEKLGNSLFVPELAEKNHLKRQLFFEEKLQKLASDRNFSFYVSLLTDCLDPCVETRLNAFEINHKYNLYPEMNIECVSTFKINSKSYSYLVTNVLKFCHSVFFNVDEYHKKFIEEKVNNRLDLDRSKSKLNFDFGLYLDTSSPTYFYDLCFEGFKIYAEEMEHFYPAIGNNIEKFIKQDLSNVIMKKIVERYINAMKN